MKRWMKRDVFARKGPVMSAIDREGGTAIWSQIERILVAEIEGGLHAEGVRLPTEADLARRFGVNRHTIRRAIGALSDRGLIKVEQGRGSFVRENVLEYMVGRRTRFTENVRRANRSPGGRKVSLERIKANAAIAGELEVKPGAAVIHLVTIGEVDERPVSYADNYFPARLFGNFDQAYAETGSITKVMERHGFGAYERAVTKVTAGLPDVTEAAALHIPRTRPILLVSSINIDPSTGARVQSGHARYAADRFQMVFDNTAEDGAAL
jgi:GntR family phosphonate transport system transcriptional regulator